MAAEVEWHYGSREVPGVIQDTEPLTLPYRPSPQDRGLGLKQPATQWPFEGLQLANANASLYP